MSFHPEITQKPQTTCWQVQSFDFFRTNTVTSYHLDIFQIISVLVFPSGFCTALPFVWSNSRCLFASWDTVNLNFLDLDFILSSFGALCWEEYDVDSFFSLTSGSDWDCYIFASVLLHHALSALVCNFTLCLILWLIFSFTYMKCYSSDIFVLLSLKSVFPSLCLHFFSWPFLTC